MAEYIVRNTFIDVPSCTAEAPSIRSSSAPPSSEPSKHSAAHTAENQSEALKAVALRPLLLNRGFKDSERNIGSIGHPELCGRQCEFVTRNPGCWAGAACRRCHLCGKEKKLADKRDRLMLARMALGSRLAVCLPFLRQRARCANFEEQAAPFLALLEREAQTWSAGFEAGVPYEEGKMQHFLMKKIKRARFNQICRAAVLPEAFPQSETLPPHDIWAAYTELQSSVGQVAREQMP